MSDIVSCIYFFMYFRTLVKWHVLNEVLKTFHSFSHFSPLSPSPRTLPCVASFYLSLSGFPGAWVQSQRSQGGLVTWAFTGCFMERLVLPGRCPPSSRDRHSVGGEDAASLPSGMEGPPVSTFIPPSSRGTSFSLCPLCLCLAPSPSETQTYSFMACFWILA